MLVALVLAFRLPLPAQPADPGNPNDFSAFKIISDHNIFDPNRRPHIAVGPAPKIVDSFSLVGTMTYAKGPFAVFDGTGSDYRKVLEPGGNIAGYTVAAVHQDSVNLRSGTNEVELKVGMQLRRNDDGRWSSGEAPEASETAYASNSGRRHSGRRQIDSSRNRLDSPNEVQPAAPPAGEADLADATGGMGGPGADLTNAPPEMPGAGPNDPVARMMQRRAQELNGNENRN